MTKKNDPQDILEASEKTEAPSLDEQSTHRPVEADKTKFVTPSQEERRDLEPILVKLNSQVPPKQGEKIVWFDPKIKVLHEQKADTDTSTFSGLECYKVILEQKLSRKVPHSFTFSIDSLPDDQFVYKVSYMISFKISNEFGWLSGIGVLLQGETPCDEIDRLLNEALDQYSGIKSEDKADEKRVDFLEAMTAKSGDDKKILEIQQFLDSALLKKCLNVKTKVKMVEPKADIAPFEHLIYIGHLKNFIFSKELGIRVKGAVVNDPDLLEVARSKYHKVDEYKDSKIPGRLVSYFEEAVTLEELATDLNKIKNKAETAVRALLAEIGKKIGFLTFEFEDPNRIPPCRIPIKTTFDAITNEFEISESQAKVPFNCELILTLDQTDRPVPWNDVINGLDWSIATLIELIHKEKYEDILDCEFNSLWGDFNERLNECGYKIDQNRFKLKPDIEAIRLKDFGFRLNIDEVFKYTATDVYPPATQPIKIFAQMQGIIQDGDNPFDKIKNLNPYDTIVDQVKSAVIGTIQLVINKLTSEQLHRRFRKSGDKDTKAAALLLEAEISAVLSKEFNIALNPGKFTVDLVESPLLNIEQGLLSRENEVFFSIFKNTSYNARLKNDFKMTFMVKEIPSDGWNRFALGDFRTYEEKMEAIGSTITNYAQAKILNSKDEEIMAVLTDAAGGNQVLEELFLKDSDLPEIVFEKYGLKMKVVTIRKMGATTIPNEDENKTEQIAQKEIITQRSLNGKHGLYCQYQENLELIQNRLKIYIEKEEFESPKYNLLCAEAEKIEEKMTKLLEAQVIISRPVMHEE
jgi:hypothetical protein